MALANGGVVTPKSPMAQYPVLDLENAWKGVSHGGTINNMQIEVAGDAWRLESGHEAILPESPKLPLNCSSVLNQVLLGSLSALPNPFAAIEKNLQDLRMNMGWQYSKEEFGTNEPHLLGLRSFVTERRRQEAGHAIGTLDAFVRESPSKYWARQGLTIQRNVTDEARGTTVSSMLQVVGVEQTASAEGEPVPIPLFEDMEGNVGIYPSEFSLYFWRQSE